MVYPRSEPEPQGMDSLAVLSPNTTASGKVPSPTPAPSSTRPPASGEFPIDMGGAGSGSLGSWGVPGGWVGVWLDGWGGCLGVGGVAVGVGVCVSGRCIFPWVAGHFD